MAFLINICRTFECNGPLVIRSFCTATVKGRQRPACLWFSRRKVFCFCLTPNNDDLFCSSLSYLDKNPFLPLLSSSLDKNLFGLFILSFICFKAVAHLSALFTKYLILKAKYSHSHNSVTSGAKFHQPYLKHSIWSKSQKIIILPTNSFSKKIVPQLY